MKKFVEKSANEKAVILCNILIVVFAVLFMLLLGFGAYYLINGVYIAALCYGITNILNVVLGLINLYIRKKYAENIED